jgi:hypothetical protein
MVANVASLTGRESNGVADFVLFGGVFSSFGRNLFLNVAAVGTFLRDQYRRAFAPG